MNNNITEDYCSFEVSKLIKEKEFAVKVRTYFRLNGSGPFETNTKFDHNHPKDQDDIYISQPTHALAIKWIRENFGIHINTYPTGVGYYCYEVFSIKKRSEPKDMIVQKETTSIQWDELYNSSEEATEAALLHTLKNLIQ